LQQRAAHIESIYCFFFLETSVRKPAARIAHTVQSPG